MIAGMFGDVGDIFGGITSPPTTAPYGTLSKTPMGPLNVGPLSTAMSTNPTSATPGLNADGDPTAVNGTSALTIHGNLSEAAQGAYDAPGTAAPFGGITDQQAFNARQNIINNGFATPQDSATLSGYLSQQNTPAAVRTAGLPAGVAAALAATGPIGAGSLTGPDAAAPSQTADATTSGQDVTAGPPSEVGPAVPGMPVGGVFASLHQIEGGVLNGQADPNNPKHYGPAQFSQDTFSDTARAHPELGIDPNMKMFGATPKQYADATQAHWNDVGAALANAGLPDTPGNRYLGWNLGVTGGIRALNAGPDASLADAGISNTTQLSNPSIYGYKDAAGWHAYSTVGQVQANLASRFAGVDAGTTASPTPSGPGVGLGLGPSAPGTFSPAGVSYGQPGEDTTGDAPAAPAPAAPVTRTVTTPTPYAGTSAETDTASNIGYDATPARTLTIHAFGLQDPANPESPMNAAANIMGLPGDTPINSMTSVTDTDQMGVVTKQYTPVISDQAKAYAEKQYPGIMDGVQTVGQLRDKIATIAATAGPPSTSTVTEPGTPAVPSTLTISPGPRNTTPFSGYTGTDGTSPSFGLNTISAGVPATINNAGTYGVPSGLGVGQDAQNLAGYSQVPSSLPTFARGVVASPGFSPEAGFSIPSTSTPDTSSPSTGGLSFNGPAAPADGSSDPTTPDGTPAKHLSVPSWAGNGAAGIVAGAALGPVGSLLGFGNTISGWFGGPTLADGINGILAHPGAPTSVTGTGDNSDQPGADTYGSSMPAPISGPGSGSAPAAPATASAGINSSDPNSTATAAYQAALAGMGRGSGTTSSATDTTDAPRPLVIHPHRLAPAPTTPLYNPMADPAVRHALGLE